MTRASKYFFACATGLLLVFGGLALNGTIAAPTGSHRQEIAETVKLAKLGKLPGIPFVTGTACLENVTAKWGQPDRTNDVPKASGRYVVFKNKNAVFGCNKGMQIFEIRTDSPALRKITLAEVKTTAGKPAITRHFNGQQMLGYREGKFRLEFVFPNTPNPRIDHVNVLYPPATANMMADYPGREW